MAFVELFAGSSVISANLAKTSILNDKDINIYNILSRFDELIVPKVFTKEDYFKHRPDVEWWKYSYCFQKMAFSGVFRYSKNGYNVPPKKNLLEVRCSEEYKEALFRWKELNPKVTNFDFMDFPMSEMENKIIIVDPPYENSTTSYNNVLDYHLYWEYIRILEGLNSTIVLFDNRYNIAFNNVKTRSMVVNGKYAGNESNKNEEGLFVFNKSLKSGQAGEDEFLVLNSGLVRADGRNFDFTVKNTDKTVELKSDYYSMEKTPNFFMERFSYDNKSGGPWQALEKGVDLFAYYYIKEKTAFWFKTKDLVDLLDRIVKSDNIKLSDVGNEKHITRGYKVPRNRLKSIYREVKYV